LKKFAFDREKFKRLVHYVIWRAGGRPGFGAVKLAKGFALDIPHLFSAYKADVAWGYAAGS
jgi:hypothetical protein